MGAVSKLAILDKFLLSFPLDVLYLDSNINLCQLQLFQIISWITFCNRLGDYRLSNGLEVIERRTSLS